MEKPKWLAPLPTFFPQLRKWVLVLLEKKKNPLLKKPEQYANMISNLKWVRAAQYLLFTGRVTTRGRKHHRWIQASKLSQKKPEKEQIALLELDAWFRVASGPTVCQTLHVWGLNFPQFFT